MNAGWIAASVRARGMAERRAGAGRCHTVSTQTSLTAALTELSGTLFATRLAGCTSSADCERATHDAVLWQLRVVAGWVPASGARLVRALAAGFELANILALDGSFSSAAHTPRFYELGVLSTAWPRLRTAQSPEQLRDGLRLSPWGAVSDGGQASLDDVLNTAWLSRLAGVAPEARPWAQAAGGLRAARMLLVDRSVPSPPFLRRVRPLLGGGWETATTLPELRASLPPAARRPFIGIDAPRELWRAEARARVSREDDALRLLRRSPPGPHTVLGALVLLESDAWRVRAALAAAAAGTGSSEVLNAVA